MLSKDNVIFLPCRIVCCTGSLHRNIAFCGGGSAVNRDLPFSRFQRYVLSGLYRICNRIVTDMDIACVRLHCDAAVFGFYGFFNIYIAVGNRYFHIVFGNYAAFPFAAHRYVAGSNIDCNVFTCVHVAAYHNVAVGHCCVYILACSDIVVYANVSGSDLQRNNFVRLHLSAYHNVAVGHCRVYILARSDIVIYANVSGFCL